MRAVDADVGRYSGGLPSHQHVQMGLDVFHVAFAAQNRQPRRPRIAVAPRGTVQARACATPLRPSSSASSTPLRFFVAATSTLRFVGRRTRHLCIYCVD